MKSSLLVLVILLISILETQAQAKYTLSGTVKDSLTGEALIGAYITISETQSGGSTNAYGFYSVTLPPGTYTMHYNFLGFIQKTVSVSLYTDLIQNVELKPKTVAIKEVVVTGQAGNHNVTSTEMSVEKLNIKEVKALPVLFGEQDIMKTLQLLPGVKSAGEGNSGFYVRGGTADENLVLLDEAPVYNTSHLLGFFSVFNSDAIKDVKLFKGGVPAEYGGRLSSVVDVHMKDGNAKEFGVSGGIGLISSRLTVEGPINKGKGSFIVSGRRTYADLFLKLSKDTTQNRTSLYFYDLNAKINYSLGANDHIFLSGYLGRDVFNFANQFGIDWGNATSTLRWNHLFSNRLFLNSTLLYSDYNYNITEQGANQQVDISSGISDFAWKEDLEFYITPQNTLKFGLSSTYHTFSPGSLKSTDATLNSRILQSKTDLESGVYLSDEYKVNNSLVFNGGVRLSSFLVLGPGTFYKYDSDGDKIDSSVYKSTSIAKTYLKWEPRFSMTYILNERNSVKASYTRNYQYLHLLSSTTSGNPTDLWLPSDQNIPPQYADQWGLGYFKNLADNKLEASVEVYYKNMENLIDYKPNADIILNPNVESQLLYGWGWAYGTEFYLRKKEGNFTGWVSYTLSRTLRQFDGIDKGKSYPAKQDEIHDIALVGIYQLNEKWTLASTWVYNTGDAVTFPNGIYEINGNFVPYYTNRNGYRMPDYHRLDISATNTKKFKNGRERSWNFSIYNVYSRLNAYTITLRTDPNYKTITQAVKTSLFPIIPSVTFNFKF